MRWMILIYFYYLESSVSWFAVLKVEQLSPQIRLPWSSGDDSERWRYCIWSLITRVRFTFLMVHSLEDQYCASGGIELRSSHSNIGGVCYQQCRWHVVLSGSLAVLSLMNPADHKVWRHTGYYLSNGTITFILYPNKYLWLSYRKEMSC